MMFPEEDAPLLKAWIVKRLENNSDADADVLADYVLALLRNDGNEARRLFETEIFDFLREDAAAFIHDIFQAIEYRLYVPGAAPPPAPAPRPPAGRQAQFPPSQSSIYGAPRPNVSPPSPTPLYHPSTRYSAPSAQIPFPSRTSRKRAYSDHEDGDVDIILTNSQSSGGLPYKQQRRGGGFGQRGGRYEDSYGPRTYRGGPPFAGPGGLPGPVPYGAPLPFAPPPIDANAILENIQLLQSLLPVDLPLAAYSGVINPLPRRRGQRCRDYDSKGYCSRGNKCNFEHENQPLYMPPPIPPAVDEYDPNDATLSLPPFGLAQPPSGQKLSLAGPLTPLATNRSDPKKLRRTKGRAPITAPGPNHDKTKTAIVVQNIPPENFTEHQIRRYFSQFGKIVEVSMQNQNHLATIKFDSWEAANAAWSSPKVIFDNRFVKVLWHKDEGHKEFNGEPTPNAKLTSSKANGHANSIVPVGDSAPTEPEVDMKEFHRKQLEAQKVHEVKMKKREEIERERQVLVERQKDLQERHAEAKRQLEAKLKASGIKNETLSSTTELSTESKGELDTEGLKAKLAALEKVADQLGIEHDGISPWFGRGRKRGGYRGRGTFVPGGIRAVYGYQGRGGTMEARHAAYAAYSLDNRPKSVALSGVDLTLPANDEALRRYLFSVGEFNEIHSTAAATHVTFKDRKTAEKFMFDISAENSIHGIEGKVEAAWASTTPQTTKPTEGDTLSTGNQEDEQTTKEKTDTGPDDAKEELEEGEIDKIDKSLDIDQGDMDYEAGEW